MMPTKEVDPSIDLLSAQSHYEMSLLQKIGVLGFVLGLFFLFMALFSFGLTYPKVFLFSSFGLMGAGGLLYILNTYLSQSAGVKNNEITRSGLTSRGFLSWLIAVLFTGFYVVYYWQGGLLEGWYRMLDPLSYWLRGKATEPWFFYGTMYSFAVFVMGVRALVKYRHSRYQIARTSMVIFSQLILAWLIPCLLVYFQHPEKYVNYFWPLSIKDGYPGNFQQLWSSPAVLSKFLLIWSLSLTFIATPVLTYFYGKRWYCSWVCGCGGLANTLGDPWRQLSSKKLIAWKFERVIIHSVLVFTLFSTAYIWYIAATRNNLNIGDSEILVTQVYGFLIGSVFSGVVGTGFYPILGTRVWCRFGCPQAAILGILQKFFSRFRITTNGGQCISCGNCSKYCEMGIDVRAYAEKGQNIVRASCVGCGMCSTVCPRGVLNLENGPRENRINRPLALSDIIKYDEDWKS